MKKCCCAVCLTLLLGLLAACSSEPEAAATVTELADDDAIYTVSYNYIRPTIHDDEIAEYCEEHGFKQITKNEDGTYTFRMDRDLYEQEMEDRRTSLIEYLEEILTDDTFSTFVLDYDLDEENDFREVSITVDSAVYLETDVYYDLIGEYILSVYQYFMEDSEAEPGTTVSFISGSTGQVLDSYEFPQSSGTSAEDYIY